MIYNIFQITNVTDKEREQWQVFAELHHNKNKLEGNATLSRFLRDILKNYKHIGYEPINKEDGKNISISSFGGHDIKQQFCGQKRKMSQSVRKFINEEIKQWKAK